MASNQCLLRELPFSHLSSYAVANLFESSSNRLDEILKESGLKDLIKKDIDPSNLLPLDEIGCDYYTEEKFNLLCTGNKLDVSFFHQNIRSLPKNAGSLHSYLSCLKMQFDVIMLSEIGQKNIPMMKHVFKDYEFEYRTPPNNPRGGVALFVRSIFKDACTVFEKI